MSARFVEIYRNEAGEMSKRSEQGCTNWSKQFGKKMTAAADEMPTSLHSTYKDENIPRCTHEHMMFGVH